MSGTNRYYNKLGVFYRETDDLSIFKNLQRVAGFVNKSSWFGGAPESWLCSMPSAKKVAKEVGTIWAITCIFNFKKTGWNHFPAMNVDPEPDIRWIYKRVYGRKNFNKLGITEKDFLFGEEFEAYFDTGPHPPADRSVSFRNDPSMHF